MSNAARHCASDATCSVLISSGSGAPPPLLPPSLPSFPHATNENTNAPASAAAASLYVLFITILLITSIDITIITHIHAFVNTNEHKKARTLFLSVLSVHVIRYYIFTVSSQRPAIFLSHRRQAVRILKARGSRQGSVPKSRAYWLPLRPRLLRRLLPSAF